MFALVLRLNFPCKYVVSGCFSFQLFFLICSFSILKTENEREKWVGFKEEKLGVKSRKTKSRSTGLLSPDTSACVLLCSIFGWTVSVKPVGR